MASGIYGIYSKSTGKWYVGQAQDIEYRLYQHRYLLSRGKDNAHLRHAYQKYGAEDFEVSVLEYCPVDELNDREVFWVAEKNAYHDGYNFTLGGGGNRGWKASEETRRIHAELTKAQWADPQIRENRLAGLSSALSRPSYRLKLSASSRKNWSMQNYRDRMNEVVRSSWADPVLRQKRMISLSAAVKSPEYKEKMRQRTTAFWQDDEYRNKTNAARNAAMQSEDYRNRKRDEVSKRWDEDSDYASRCMEGLSKAWDSIRVPILQVETGTVFASATEAAEAAGSKSHAHITSACSGKRVTAYGFHWRYAADSESDWKVRRAVHLASLKKSGGRGFRERTIVCVETGACFSSAKLAADSVGVDPSNITKVCKGNQVSAGGYHWRYADE